MQIISSNLQTYILTHLTICLLALTSLSFSQEQLTLDRALGLALSSPSVKLADIQVENSRKQLAIASSLVSAELSTGYSVTTGELTAPSLEEDQSLDENSFDPIRLTASFNVIPYGPRYDSIEQAQARLEQSKLDFEDSKAQIVILVLEQYLSALRSSQEIEVDELALELAKVKLEASQVRFESGAVSASQLTQAQIDVQEAETTLTTSRLTYSQALLSLSNTLGISVSSVEQDRLVLSLPEKLDTEAQLLRRSDIQNALLNIAQAERDAAANLRENLPSGSVSLGFANTTETQNFNLSTTFDTNSYQPSLTASYDFDYGASVSFPVDGNSTTFNISLGLSIPLDTSLPDALELASLAIEQAKLNYQQTLETAKLTFTNAQQQISSLEANLEVTEEVTKQAREILEIASERYTLGLITPIDVLEAELNLKEQELRLARAEDNLLFAQLHYLNTLAIDLMEVLQ
ncbi:MAG: TolC family protein [Trueperaceae bacterium]|nr:TolC family protein [Trueperaceae bacterium]